jgi:hypothetical protein
MIQKRSSREERADKKECQRTDVIFVLNSSFQDAEGE